MGSSPRLRGTRDPLETAGFPFGIIPALAGNTAGCTPCRARSRDHPRACGEHCTAIDRIPSRMGSSPRLRGTHTDWIPLRLGFGIIPALAGNTACCRSRRRRGRDHPRACGEHHFPPPVLEASWGSSPRLRGTPGGASWHPAERGIIPALAGNTVFDCAMVGPSRDHPRACGEHTGACRPDDRHPGIIPALAGNTGQLYEQFVAERDHPRACGEHSAALLARTVMVGSSPRLRGTPAPQRKTRPRTGIIPALAGNTISPSFCTTKAEDHPRACGEHGRQTRTFALRVGSSPRLRGTPQFHGGTRRIHGIIPALAGNTIR